MPAQILVIDNEPSVVDVLAEILSAEGHVVIASPAALSVDQIAEARPDLLILDLPVGRVRDGWDLVRRIKAHGEIGSMPVILMSSDMYRIHSHAAAVARMDGVWMLIKPFTIDGLVTVVNAGLDEADGAQAMAGARLNPAYLSDLQ
jgi:DNA-binding response OmpR family regulator